jgi:hypothetical protein
MIDAQRSALDAITCRPGVALECYAQVFDPVTVRSVVRCREWLVAAR